MIGRIKAILLTPETEWPVIEQEPGTPAYLFANYVVYLAAIPAMAGFIGSSIVGVTAPPLGTIRVPLFVGLLGAVISYVLTFAAVYVVAIIIDQLAPRFGGVKDFGSALKVTVYSYTPFWVASIFQLIGGLRFIGYVVAFFGVYLVWIGLPRLMKVPPGKAVPYVVVACVCGIAIMLAFTLFEGLLLT
jgi:hypothetical protein